MNLGEILKVAWSSLISNKLRSLLTMLGVIIGVAAVIVMISISAGTEASIAESIEGLGSNLLFISSSVQSMGPGMSASSSSSGLVYDDLTAITARIDGIQGATTEQTTSQDIDYGEVTLESVTIVGATSDYLEVRDLQVADGRFYNDTDNEKSRKVAVLGATIAEELFGTADPIGQIITAGDVKLSVVGVLAERGLVSGTDFDAQIYIPIQVIFDKFSYSQFARFMGDSVRQIIVAVDDAADMTAVAESITYLLVSQHEVTLDTADFEISSQEDIIATQEATTASFRTLLGWVAGVSLIVGGIGIMNIMLVSVTERTREIGLRQAIGATPADIQVQFLSEALMLSLLGGLLGVLAGVGGAVLFGQVSDMRTVIVPYSILLSFGSAAVIGIFFGYLPAQQAARLDPIVALRHE